MSELWAAMYTQEKAEINGRTITHYMVTNHLGNCFIITAGSGEDEQPQVTIWNDYARAQKAFRKMCNAILSEKGV